jgi:TPR repeat protein
MRRILTGLVLILMLTGAAVAEPMEDALAASQRGDYATALRLWRPLAEQGDAEAQNNLGFAYADGQGVPQDYAEAVKWYRLAAEQGNAIAQYSLGFQYDKGQGVPQDYVQAHMWYNLAASRFSASEAEHRNKAIKNRDIVARNMTPAQIAEAQKLAREWKPK